MHKIGSAILLAAVIVFVFAAAYRYPPGQKDSNRGIFEAEISGKLTRGITNAAWGWTELAITPVDMGEGPQHNILGALFLGIPYGAFRAVGRTLVGVYEISTCYAPQKPIFNPIEGEVL